ncbi:MAG: RNA polymerase sigma factor [Candidatus Paceibacterota bacterium]|jgi:RNA polymerase sigma-70 factor (ECF subfamily)
MAIHSSQMKEVNKQNLRENFTQSYDQFSNAIFRFCYFQTSSREKALDLTQETFTRTWEYLSTGKNVENLRAFLYKVAGNLIIDDRRKKKSESLDKMTEAGFDLKSEINEVSVKENIFQVKLALEALDKLGEKYKEVLLLRFVEEMEIHEIAKMIGENENNVSVRIHRGVEKLKNLLGEN